MGLIAVVEADLRAISAEARRRYPAVKDAAEHAILKVHVMIQANSGTALLPCMACADLSSRAPGGDLA